MRPAFAPQPAATRSRTPPPAGRPAAWPMPSQSAAPGPLPVRARRRPQGGRRRGRGRSTRVRRGRSSRRPATRRGRAGLTRRGASDLAIERLRLAQRDRRPSIAVPRIGSGERCMGKAGDLAAFALEERVGGSGFHEPNRARFPRHGKQDSELLTPPRPRASAPRSGGSTPRCWRPTCGTSREP